MSATPGTPGTAEEPTTPQPLAPDPHEPGSTDAQGRADGGLSLRTNMLWNTGGSITRLVCNYLVTIAVVRLSRGFDANGVLTLATTVSSLAIPFAEFRLRTLQVTDVTGERSSREYVGLRVLTSLIAFALGVAYSLATNGWASLGVITLYLVYSIITTFIEGFHAIDQRHRRMDYIGLSYILQGVTTLAVFCLGLWLTNSLEVAVGLMAVAVAGVAVLYDVPRTIRFEPLRPRIAWRPALAVLGSLLPLVLAQVASSAVLAIPRQQLAHDMGEGALGIYSSIAAPAVIVQMGAVYVYSPLMGEFAKAFQSDKRAGLRLLGKTVLALIAVTALISIALLFLGRPILWLMFGDKVLPYIGLLQPTILCTLMTAFAWFFNDLLLALRDFKASFLGNAAAVLVTLAFSSIMVAAFGMNGVSWVGVAAYGTAVAVLAAFFTRDYRRLRA
ncbi:polysaccharide biosynthesis protein [Actinomyces bowdenii]|uniref:lipopolysaccharide biosynthesis protein n=1 Tax=Actinomyces bowdenii TaxID=131109 RepID=UPI00214BBEEE|nr:polysaccharide biosynthesis protein [Actinomyces bowdenii]